MQKPAINQFFSRVSFQEKLLFTKHLATMYKAGIPLTESLSTLIAQTRSITFKKVLENVLSDIDNGQSLAKSLAKHPRVFDQFYVSLIEISEESGTLEENLEFLAVQLSKDYSLHKKIQSALLYPTIVVSVMLVIGIFISYFILPKLVDFFRSFDVELPATTKVLLLIANTAKNYGVIILITFIGIFFLFRLLIRLMPVKYFWHSLIIKLPLIGSLVGFGQVARFSRNLGTLIKSGVPVTKSLEITADTLTNLKFKKDLKEITKHLTKGKNIGSAMQNAKFWEYPPIVSKMVSVGEKTGKLDEVLLYLSDFYEDEIDDLSKNLSATIEPALLVIIAFAVGFVALAIISPIYELTGSIRR